MLAEIVLGLLSNIWSPNLRSRAPRELRRAYREAYAEARETGDFDVARLDERIELYAPGNSTNISSQWVIAKKCFAAGVKPREFRRQAKG